MIASHYPHGYDMAVGGARGGDGDTSSSSSSSSGGVEDSAAIISDLISQGASINAHTERTGETSLHLAAR
jgi:Notch-like protein